MNEIGIFDYKLMPVRIVTIRYKSPIAPRAGEMIQLIIENGVVIDADVISVSEEETVSVPALGITVSDGIQIADQLGA